MVLGVIVNDQLSAADHVTGVVQQSLARSENSLMPWYPRRVTAKRLSSDGHREVNVLRSSVHDPLPTVSISVAPTIASCIPRVAMLTNIPQA